MNHYSHSKALEAFLQSSDEGSGLTEDELAFYYELYHVEEEFLELFIPVDLDHSLLTSAYKEGGVALLKNLKQFPDLKTSLTDLFFDLLDLILNYFPDSSLSALDLDEETFFDPFQFFSAMLSLDFAAINQRASEQGLVADELFFLLLHWLRPLMVWLREKSVDKAVRNLDLNIPRCPFCGYYPDIALLNKQDNTKTLHCQLCDNEWGYKSSACAICGNEDSQTIGYFEVVDAADIRVDFCDSCRAYLKCIISEHGSGSIDLVVKNLLTPSIDASALAKGYQKP